MFLLKRFSHYRYPMALLIAFQHLFVLLAIAPYDRKDWLLENVLTVACIVVLALTARKFPLSRISYTLIFIFLCMHQIGSHYTYAMVPYDTWFSFIFGESLNSIMGWSRNHFDRLAHFSYGLLLAYPIRELFHRVAHVRGFWGYFLPLDITMSTSMLYELIEWAAAEVVGGELGAAYLGTQRDIWDAHKDMGLASLGALLAMLVTAAINAYLQRDFAREFSESIRVKDNRPLGENAIRRMWRKKKAGGDKR
ncbi:MAG: DUF2238 domain-containing protein [Candidatus Zixiibacteriota bacterium]|nr:MAG: DUF2238 domain-containing protein [candidate division Zixibacteria bacterium]